MRGVSAYRQLEFEGNDFLELVGGGGPHRGRLLGLHSGGVSGSTS